MKIKVSPNGERRRILEHINLLGRYAFLVPEAVQRGQLRPFAVRLKRSRSFPESLSEFHCSRNVYFAFH